MTNIGLQIPNFSHDVPGDELFDVVLSHATAAEDAGAWSVWVMDHFLQLPALGGPENPMLEAYTLLGALAARTERVQLGTLVTGVTYRNPAMLGKILTTLDVVSKGRAICGIGAAWYDVEHTALGFDFPPLRERFERLEEAVTIIKAMFAGERPTIDGGHYRTADLPNLPPPVQAGGPKVMIGGGGEKKTLRLVARHADYANVTGDPATIRHKIDVLHQHCADLGRDPSTVTMTRMSSLFLCDTDEEADSTMAFLRNAAGDDAERMFDVGTRDTVFTRLHEIVDAGCDHLIFNMPLAPADKIHTALSEVIAEFA
ncbi:MAG TPA: LLM class F420-dependent oxidoreductase [Acidimicrobiales bacterium]